MPNQITFKIADTTDEKTIFSWLLEPHMIEFWDNSQEHKDDILNFIHGRKQHYFSGTTKYFIGLVDNVPFAFILVDTIIANENLPKPQKDAMSKSGNTICIDFGIGNKEYLGKGLASKTLEQFMFYYQNNIDSKADTFFIDPDENNPRAKHVYEKAGFKHIGDYIPNKGAFIGHNTLLMIRKLPLRTDSSDSQENWQFKSFHEMNCLDFYDIFHLRSEVFVVEQNCAYNDFDYYDQKSIHMYMKNNNKVIAYARIIPPNIKYEEASIGRVVVSKDMRGKNYGKLLTKEAVNYIENNYRGANIKISAQEYLQKFYESLGFVKISESYLEDKIPHILMLKNNS